MGVTEHGRVSHQELATAMSRIKVWAYPTEFTEIHCITALKANQAGLIPVVALVAALKETVADTTYSVDCEDIYTNEQKQAEFVDMVALALNADGYEPRQVAEPYWPDVASVWDEAVR
jgi:hypothetical protein